jgi:formylmethanofuran dehydrogenase subunit E
MPPELTHYLAQSAARHDHLCPRQVLGVRMGLAGLAALELAEPPSDKSLLVISETDGCFVDGLEVTCQVSVGRRTLRIVDLGKVAAVFAHVPSGRTVRLSPRQGVRLLASRYAPQTGDEYQAQLLGYQAMPADELFAIEPVTLEPSIEVLISLPGLRVNCEQCGEEIMNARQVNGGGRVLCRACAGERYYQKS